MRKRTDMSDRLQVLRYILIFEDPHEDFNITI